jgi:hypothetical protein
MTDPNLVPQPAVEHHHPPIGRIVLTVVGAFLILVSLAFGVGGVLVTGAYATQRDDDGFFTTRTERLSSPTFAITSQKIDLGTRHGPDGGYDLGDLATVRLRASGREGTPIFIGIGPERDVEGYLADVAHDEIDHLSLHPFRVSYDFQPGGAPSAPPGAQQFWVASAQGPGVQRVEWDLKSGDWSVVIMNADGSRAVDANVSVGAKSDLVLPIGLGLLGAFVLFAALGTTLLVLGVVGLGRRVAYATTTGGAPVHVTGRYDEHLSRWLWLVKWILLIPHFIILAVLWLAFWVVTVIAFFAILFTGRYPRSLFDFNAGVLRWTWRVLFYGVYAFGTDRYPPFTLGAAPDYPAHLDIAYPERLSRGLVLVKWWLLAIPQYVVVGIFVGGTATVVSRNGAVVTRPGLILWLVFVAVVALLFVGRYPRGIARLVVGLNRWVFRVVVYAALMTDTYPPFRLDQGEEEPEPDGGDPVLDTPNPVR